MRSAGLPAVGMENLGQPVSHLALRDGVPVYDRDGDEIGVVDRVMSDEVTGIFEGVIIHTRPLIGAQHLFASHDQIGELREHGVRLTVPRAELYELDEHAGRRRRDDGVPEAPIERLLRKAWDWLVGAR
jgi:PRC-barrel domain protein